MPNCAFIPHDETAGLRAGERLQAAPEIAGAAFLLPAAAGTDAAQTVPGRRSVKLFTKERVQDGLQAAKRRNDEDLRLVPGHLGLFRGAGVGRLRPGRSHRDGARGFGTGHQPL